MICTRTIQHTRADSKQKQRESSRSSKRVGFKVAALSKEFLQEDIFLGRIEMQSPIQAETTSPKTLIGTSSQQAKFSADNAQISPVEAVKGKKRERADASLESSKRERLVKMEDSAVNSTKQDNIMKAEDISAITNKDDSILNLASIDKLIFLMQQERSDGLKSLSDLASRRSMLAGVIASTDREDCLNRFVQLGGLPILDDWLQEAHRAKFGEGGSPEDADKVFEDLLLVLLRALDKLPVNLDALKTCIVGKSVNNLRSHKNVEIQKKARKLVEIWKKRVEAEMKQSGEGKVNAGISWSCKQPPIDSLHSSLMKGGGSSDVAAKSSGSFTSNSKTTSNLTTVGSSDGFSKVAVSVPSHGKPSAAFSSNLPAIKDTYKFSGPSISSDSSMKDEKSTSPSFSQNHASHWSSIKACSIAPLHSKVSAMVQRSNSIGSKGSIGPTLQGTQKETLQGKPVVWSRYNAVSSEKSSNAALMSEKGASESGNVEHASCQRPMGTLSDSFQSPLLGGNGGTGASVTASVEERVSPLVASGLSEGKPWTNCSPPAVTSAEGVSVPRSCSDVSRDSGLQSNLREDRSEGQRNGEHIGESTRNLGSSAEMPGTADEPLSAGENPSINPMSVPQSSTEVIGASKSGKHENASQINHNAEIVSALSDTTGPVVDESPMSLLATVADTELMTSQGIESALKNVGSKIEQRTEDGEMQSECIGTSAFQAHTRGHSISCKEGKLGNSFQGLKLVHSSPSPPGSSLGDNESLEDCLNRARASKEQADVTVRQPVLHTSSGRDENLSKEKSPIGALPSELDATSGELLHIKQDSSRETREAHLDAGDMEIDDRTKMAFMNLRDHSRVSMGKKSDSESGDSGSSGSEKSSRFTQNLASDLEQFIGRSSDSDGSEKESFSGSPEEDALEVARQVAKEVEQEMEKYSKPLGSASSDLEMQEANVLSTHESVEKTTNNLDLTSPDHDVRNKINSEVPEKLTKDALGCSENERVIKTKDEGQREKLAGPSPDFGVEAFQSASCTGACSSVVAAPCDEADSGAPEVEYFNHGQISSMNGRSEVMGGSNDAMQTVATIPVSSASSGSAVKFDVLKASEIRLPLTELHPLPGAIKDIVQRPVFDLNEGFDEGVQEELTSSVSGLTFPSSSASYSATSNMLTAPIAVVASTNGSFIPPPSPVLINKDCGWKGSAANSAFRPAEPRRTQEIQSSVAESNLDTRVRAPLDIDLNVADYRMLEDFEMPAKDISEGPSSVATSQASGLLFTNLSNTRPENNGSSSSAFYPTTLVSSRPVLDLNRVDENDYDKSVLKADSTVSDNLATSNSQINVRSSGRSVMRDFDLNDGPIASFEEVAIPDEPVQHHHFLPRGPGMTSAPAMPTGLRMTGAGELLNVAPWFLPGNSFSAMTIPAFTGPRSESPFSMASAQPFLGAGIGMTPFNTDIFRPGAAISSSPAVAFPVAPAGPYSYPAFPFGGSFALSSSSLSATSTLYGDAANSASFSSISSQMANSGAVSHGFVRPSYVKGLPEDAASDSNAAWGRFAFDLNAGPDSADSETIREENMSRHPFILTNNQQMGAFRQVAAPPGVPKRKGPEGGWEAAYRSGYKHPTWR